jgi:hypothetical protein
MTYPPPPYFGVGEFKYAGIFFFEFDNFFFKVLLAGKYIYIFYGRNDDFFWKVTHVFLYTPPYKQGGESIFEGIFRFGEFFLNFLLGQQKAGAPFFFFFFWENHTCFFFPDMPRLSIFEGIFDFVKKKIKKKLVTKYGNDRRRELSE